MKLKRYGFYLSPDGKHIVFIQKERGSKYFVEVLAGSSIGDDVFIVDILFDICSSDLDTIFSAWIYLGQ